MRSIRTLICAFMALAVQTLPAPASAEQQASDRIVIERGSVKLSTGEAVPYEIGTLYVPENRANPGSRRIGIGFARETVLIDTPAKRDTSLMIGRTRILR